MRIKKKPGAAPAHFRACSLTEVVRRKSQPDVVMVEEAQLLAVVARAHGEQEWVVAVPAQGEAVVEQKNALEIQSAASALEAGQQLVAAQVRALVEAARTMAVVEPRLGPAAQ